MKRYKIDLTTQTLYVSKEFQTAALKFDSEESVFIKECRELCPKLKIRQLPPSKSRNHKKGLTYIKMEHYIGLHENAAELLESFRIVKEAAKSQNNPYLYVYQWFMMNFPDFYEMPNIVNGKLYSTTYPIEMQFCGSSLDAA
jgi:hypothetical protein